MVTSPARGLAGLVVILTLAACPLPAHPQSSAGPAYVTRVIEGDTLYAELGGRLEAVRYLGVNTPRIEHPTRGAEAYADAAREANRRLVEGKWIHLVFESQPRDRHGRLLAYVWVGALFVNAALVHYGYGEAAVSTSTTRYGDYFRALETGARQDGRGLWRDPVAQAYHRPRPPESAAAAGDYEERAADASGGRVFSAPAPFAPPPMPASPAPAVGAPASRSPTPGPSYSSPRGATSPR
ncbi:MAG TPA: thermonuclease family protein [Methylomirabilota bacterium]|nr:thermonuclease family protein [Methylomirabilota bacterium]